MTLADKSLFAIVLAAGSSKRFGSSKQLAQFRGKPLVHWATEAAKGACAERVILVTAPSTHASVVAAGSERPFFVVNDEAKEGLGRSIALAAKAICNRCDAVLLLLADQPLVTAEHLRCLVEHWSGDDDAIVATVFGGTIGPPVLFPRGSFSALQELQGDSGARTLLRDSRFAITTVEFEPAGTDVDTTDDLADLNRG